MRESLNRYERTAPDADVDPRSRPGAEVISLATRDVMPAVTQRKGGSDALGLAAGVAVVGLLGAVTLIGLNHSRQTSAQGQAAAPPPSAASQPEPLPTAPAVPPQVITVPQPAPASQPVLAAPPNAQPVAGPASNPLATPTVVFDASALPPPAPGAPATAATAGNPNDEFAARVGGVGGSTAVAAAAVNPQTTVTQGALIPAVLETAIDTDVPGYVRAVVSTDVRSFDGSRVLIPRSSRLIGQYKSGVQAGQKRAYVIWSRVIRPDGVSVNIASPATAFGGQTGLAGQVDNHFFQRFGSAMLLSVVGGLSALGNNASTVVIGSQTQSAAATAVGQTGQISPTIRVRQGEPIRVFTARDLDFSRVTTQ